MDKKQENKAAEPKSKQIDRRQFLELSRKAAIVAPPAIGLLIAATDAKAHCVGNGNSVHAQPSCATNH